MKLEIFSIQIQVDLRHKDETKDLPVVEIGIDLTEFYQSVEWDILSVPAQRYVYEAVPYEYTNTKL